MAYEDMPSGVYAVPRPGTTIRPILKPGVLCTSPLPEWPGFLLPAPVVPDRTELRVYGVLRSSLLGVSKITHMGDALLAPRRYATLRKNDEKEER